MAPSATETLLSEKLDTSQRCNNEPQPDEQEDKDTPLHKRLVNELVDTLFSSLVVAPMVVGVWRGCWGLMDMNAKLFPFAQTFLLGTTIHICFALVRSMLLSRSKDAWIDGAGRWLQERLLSRIYLYVFTLANIMHWRGGWGLFDTLVITLLPTEGDPHRPVLIAAFLLTAIVGISFLRSARNILASPYFLVLDGKEPTYIFTTRFKKIRADSSRETALYILDCVFSVAVVGSLVVFVWRGSWALLDIYLYPGDVAKSCWTSLAMGYMLVGITFSLQAPLRWTAARLHGAPRLLLADVYHLMAFVATVNVWRGVWGLIDLYMFPETPRLSNWCSHIGCLLILMMLNCSNTILVRGVYIDAEEPAGECVVFPCHYIRLLAHKDQIKRRHRRALAAAANRRNSSAIETSLQPLHLPVIEEKVELSNC